MAGEARDARADAELDPERLEDYLVRHDVALVKAGYFRQRLRIGKEDEEAKALPRRQAIPAYQLLHGDQLRGLWTDLARLPKRKLFAVSHAWLSLEHPDPGGLRLEAIVDELDWLRAVDEDLVFFDYCSLFQVDLLHPDYSEDLPREHEALRTAAQQKLYQGALRHMDVLFSNSVARVIVMPEIYDISKVDKLHGKPITPNRLRYVQRGWSGTEFSIAARAGRIVFSARPLEGTKYVRDDDLDYIEEYDYKSLTVTVEGPQGISGTYLQKKQFEGAPYFEQHRGKNYLYRKYEERWFISPELGSSSKAVVWAECEGWDKEPPAAFWKAKPMEHPDIEVMLMLPGGTALTVYGFAWIRSTGNGLYRQRGEHHGRPYYQNEDGLFIYSLRNGEWCLGPVLGAFGELIWAECKNAMPKPPDGKWPAHTFACPDVHVVKPAQGDQMLVSGFGFVRERGNAEFRRRGAHEGASYYTNADSSLFMYKWREQRWRIARTLGATGSQVLDEIICDDLEPPPGRWKQSRVDISEAGESSYVTLTGARASELPGKARVFVCTDGDEWREISPEVRIGVHDFPAPVLARRANVVLEKGLKSVRCIKRTGVAYRRSMDLQDRIDAYAGPTFGQHVPVRSRQGAWVETEKGWLPLSIDGERLFEGTADMGDGGYSVQLAGYRASDVEALSGLEELGVDPLGVSPAQFAALHAQSAVHFSYPGDRDLVLAIYRRACPRDEEADGRVQLFRSLVRSRGRGAAQHISVVRDALGEADGHVAAAAAAVLGELAGKLWEQDVKALAALMSSPDGHVREAAVRSLGKNGEAAASHADEVIALLDDPDLHVRIAAAGSLAGLGPGSAEAAEYAAELLVELMLHRDQQVRAAAVASLGTMHRHGAAHVDAVVRLLSDPVLIVRIATARALADLGEAGAAHHRELRPLLEDPRMRHVAIEALAKMGCGQEEVAALMRSPHWYVRRDTLVGLRAVGPAAATHTSAIAALLADVHRDVRLEAVVALAAIGAPAAAHLETLRRLAQCPSEELDLRSAAQVAAETVARVAGAAPKG